MDTQMPPPFCVLATYALESILGGNTSEVRERTANEALVYENIAIKCKQKSNLSPIGNRRVELWRAYEERILSELILAWNSFHGEYARLFELMRSESVVTHFKEDTVSKEKYNSSVKAARSKFEKIPAADKGGWEIAARELREARTALSGFEDRETKRREEIYTANVLRTHTSETRLCSDTRVLKERILRITHEWKTRTGEIEYRDRIESHEDGESNSAVSFLVICGMKASFRRRLLTALEALST